MSQEKMPDHNTNPCWMKTNQAQSSPLRSIRQGDTVNLPGNVKLEEVPNIVKKALVSSSSAITINLPANVSTEVAQAYARGFSMMAGARQRSRSRSPERDRFRADRDFRDRERHRDRGRFFADDYRHGRASSYVFEVSRGRDEYRPGREDDSRHRLYRLSPPKESKPFRDDGR
jgi:hypothetical protein